MSQFQLGRLLIGPPLQWYEALGDPVTTVGGAVVPAQRTAPQFPVSLGTYAADGRADTPADRLRIRRQLRSMLNNTPLKQAGLYVVYGDDLEQNGWYVPDQAQLQDWNSTSGLATGLWQMAQQNLYLVGHLRTHKEAKRVWMKPLTGGLYPRDTLGAYYSTDFSYLPSLALTYLPPGATRPAATVSGQLMATTALPAGRDGGQCVQAVGLTDLTVMSYERAESSMNLGDVVVYDRRGNIAKSGYYKATVLQDKPSLYWRLNETSGTVAADTSGNSHTGTYGSGITLNQAGALTGSADTDTGIVATNSSNGVLSTFTPGVCPLGFTMECWIKPSALSGYGSIMGNFSPYVNLPGVWVGTYNASVGIRASLDGTTSSSTYVNAASASTALTVGQWTHVVLTHDGSNLILYLNGVPLPMTNYGPAGGSGTSIPLAGNLNHAWPFFVAYNDPGEANSLPGSFDETAFYPYCLTPKQVSDHYAAGVCYDGGNQWEEVYGPDFPWSWLTSSGTQDAPVLSNGLVRVRYDTSPGVPTLAVDAWTPGGGTNGTAAWVNQGSMSFDRNPGQEGGETTWIAGSLVEYTPERAVMQLTLATSGDAYSLERFFVTVQRGVIGATIEWYLSPSSTGGAEQPYAVWNPALQSGTNNANTSFAKVDSKGSGSGASWTPGAAGSAAFLATAGQGSGPGNGGLFASGGGGQLGASSFAASENWVAMLTCPTQYATVGYWQTNLVTAEAANQASAGNVYLGGYTVGVGFIANANYQQIQISFSPTSAFQVFEAESGSLDGTSSVVTDSTASGGSAVKETQTVSTSDTSSCPTSPPAGTYRVFARVKVDSGATGTFFPHWYDQNGSSASTTSTSWIWLDLGEINIRYGNYFPFTIRGYRSAGSSGAVYIDRVEAILTQDRLQSNPIYSGARDAGQAALNDSRQLAAVVAR